MKLSSKDLLASTLDYALAPIPPEMKHLPYPHHFYPEDDKPTFKPVMSSLMNSLVQTKISFGAFNISTSPIKDIRNKNLGVEIEYTKQF